MKNTICRTLIFLLAFLLLTSFSFSQNKKSKSEDSLETVENTEGSESKNNKKKSETSESDKSDEASDSEEESENENKSESEEEAEEETEKEEIHITIITINNARQTSYKKDEKTGNDVIYLEGAVSLSVQKDNTITDIRADKVSYDRTTEMLYAEGSVEIKTVNGSLGGDKVSASSIIMNTSTLEGIFDNGKVIQSQSDTLNLPSGSTLIVFSRLFAKGTDNVITFKNSSLTFCDEEDPHWHIDASRTWLLPGGEFAFLNALLYVGAVPVMYFPAFYYPKDELVFNPVFNYENRPGYSVQTTTYLFGRKPLENNTSSSSTSAGGSLKDFYNFIKPNTLKEQVREGLVLHNLDQDFQGDTSHYVKLMADWYSNLGIMVGLDGKIQPWKKVIQRLDFNIMLGFSNTVFKNGINYYPFSSRGKKYSDTSNFLGVKLPFRFGSNFEFQVSNPLHVSVSLPIYSDPFFAYDFKNNRQESMDWISYLIDNSSDSDEFINSSEMSSLLWNLNTSYSTQIPDILRPYISSVSVSTKSSVDISSRNTDFSYTDGKETVRTYDVNKYEVEWTSFTPARRFYYPSLVTPVSGSISVGGTIFKWPPDKRNNNPSPQYVITMNKPDELKTEKQLKEEKERAEKEAAEKEAEEKGEETKKKEDEDSEKEEKSEEEEFKYYLPELDYYARKESLDDRLTYSLDYSLGTNVITQFAYSNQNLHTADDFDWNNIRSSMYTIKIPMNLSSKLNYGGSFFSIDNRFSAAPVFQDHPFVSTDTKNGYTESEIDNLKVSDYKAMNRDILNSNTYTLRPLYYFPIVGDSSVSWNSSIKLYRRLFTGTAENPEWEEKFVDWEDDECITVNSLSVDLRAKELNNKLSQSLRFEAVIPPLKRRYTATLTLSFPFVSAGFSTGIEEVRKDEITKEFDKWKKVPFSQSLNVSLFNSQLRLSESYTYNLEDENHESLKFSASMYGLQASYVMSYVQGYDFDNGWKIKKDREFLPYSFSISYSYPSKTFYKWFNRITFSPGLRTSIVTDLLRPTNSYFLFTPSIKFRIHEFIDISFSASTKNSVLYWYFHNEEGDMYSDWGGFPGNILKDLIDSYRFDNTQLREQSGFKLKSLNMTISHDLHDWTANMTLKIEPRIITENGKKMYDFKPYVTIGVVWNPMASMKTSIIDEYGEWKLE